MAKFKMTLEKGRALLFATGIKNAPNYDDKRVLQRLKAYDEIPAEDHESVKDPELVRIQQLLLSAIGRGDEVVIAEPEPMEEVRPKGEKLSTSKTPPKTIMTDLDQVAKDNPEPKPARRGPGRPPKEAKEIKEKKAPFYGKKKDVTPPKPEPIPEPEEEENEEEISEPQARRKGELPPTKPVSNRGVGIKELIIEMLRKSTKDKPISRREIAEALIAAYPTRNPRSLTQTVAYYVPGYLNEGGLVVQKSEAGYWLAKDKIPK